MNVEAILDRMPLERVIELHRRGLEKYSAEPLYGAPQDGCVESALGAAANALLYGDEEADSLHFAAYAFSYLARKQCFADGNKRVAWYVLTDLLLIDGLTIQATDDEAYAFALSASGGASMQSILDWLTNEGRLVPAPFM